MKVDAEQVRLREDAQAKAVLDRSKFGFIVLGGSHELTESVRRVSGGRCGNLRVTTRRFKEFSRSLRERHRLNTCQKAVLL